MNDRSEWKQREYSHRVTNLHLQRRHSMEYRVNQSHLPSLGDSLDNRDFEFIHSLLMRFCSAVAEISCSWCHSCHNGRHRSLSTRQIRSSGGTVHAGEQKTPGEGSLHRWTMEDLPTYQFVTTSQTLYISSIYFNKANDAIRRENVFFYKKEMTKINFSKREKIINCRLCHV